MAKANLLNEIPRQAWNIAWNVNSQAVGSSEASIKYLTPYVFRVAISNNRIIKVEDHKVFIRYQKTGSNRPRTMVLEILEFIRRFLQHVLPSGFMKVRHYGLLSPSFRLGLKEVCARIELAFGFAVATVHVEPVPMPEMTCRYCGHVLTYLYSLIPNRRMAMEGGPPG